MTPSRERDDGASVPAAVPTSLGTVRPPRLADQLYAQLHQQITVGRYPQDSRLPSEFDLCAAFGVSRPVVREALSRLKADGLVESQRGAGSYVRRRPNAELLRLAPIGGLPELVRCMELRCALEGDAAYLAASRRTDADLAEMQGALRDLDQAIAAREVGHEADFRFHRAVATACRNELFVSTLQSLSAQIFDYMRVMRSLALRSSYGRWRLVQSEHERIYEAIRDEDPEAAREAMRSHINNSRSRTLEDSFAP